MTHSDRSRARRRLDAALHGLAVTFQGMTAHPDEHNCECHWGSAEELAQLKVADTELDPDLLERTWEAIDWSDHASVLRRILPQFARALVGGRVEALFGMETVGRSFALGHWQRWPAEQAGEVGEFLHAWWTHTLTDPEPVVPAYEVLKVLAEASGTVRPWLRTWEVLAGPAADQHLVETVTEFEYELLGDQLPWFAWENGEEMRVELSRWLCRHAPARLCAIGGCDELLHRVRLLGLTGEERWRDPHWPGHRY